MVRRSSLQSWHTETRKCRETLPLPHRKARINIPRNWYFIHHPLHFKIIIFIFRLENERKQLNNFYLSILR